MTEVVIKWFIHHTNTSHISNKLIWNNFKTSLNLVGNCMSHTGNKVTAIYGEYVLTSINQQHQLFSSEKEKRWERCREADRLLFAQNWRENHILFWRQTGGHHCYPTSKAPLIDHYWLKHPFSMFVCHLKWTESNSAQFQSAGATKRYFMYCFWLKIKQRIKEFVSPHSTIEPNPVAQLNIQN